MDIASLGLGIDTTGLEKAEKSLRKFAQKSKDMTTKVDRDLKKIESGLKSIAVEAGKSGTQIASAYKAQSAQASQSSQVQVAAFEKLQAEINKLAKSAQTGFGALAKATQGNTAAIEAMNSRVSALNRNSASTVSALGAQRQAFAQNTQAVKSFRQANDELVASVKGLQNIAIGAFVGVALTKQIVDLSDAYVKYSGTLRIATEANGGYEQSLKDVQSIATASQASLNSVANFYARLTRNTQQLGVSQEQVARITEVVSLGLKIQGNTTVETNSVLLQLSQALGSGVLRGEEFNTMSENGSILLDLLAEKLGVARGELREMAFAGKLTTDILIEAFDNPTILDKFRDQAKDVATMSGAFQVLYNELVLFFGQTADDNGFIAAFNAGIVTAARNIDVLVGAATGFVALKIGTAIGSYVTNLALLATGATTAASAFRNLGLAAMFLANNPFIKLLTVAATAGTAFYVYLQSVNDEMGKLVDYTKILKDKSDELASVQKEIASLVETDAWGNTYLKNVALQGELNKLLEEEKKIKGDIASIQASQTPLALKQKELAEVQAKLATDPKQGELITYRNELRRTERQIQAEILELMQKQSGAEQVAIEKANAKVSVSQEQLFYAELLATAQRTEQKVAEDFVKNLLKNYDDAQVKAKQLAQEIGNYKKTLSEQIELLEMQLKLGRELTPVEQERIKLENKYGQAVTKSLEPLLARKEALESEIAINKALDDVLEEIIKDQEKLNKASEKATESSNKRTASLEKGNAKLEEEIKGIRGLLDPLANAEASYYDLAAAKAASLAVDARRQGNTAEAEQLEREAQANRDRARLLREKQSAEIEKELQDANQEFYEGLLNAWKKASDEGIDYLRDQLERQVFQIAISAVLGNTGALAGALSNVFGTGGNVVGGSAGLLGNIANSGSILGGLGASSAAMSASFAKGAYDIATLAGASVETAASIGNLGAAVGKAVPYVGAAMLAFQGIKAISNATKGERRQGQKTITGMEGTDSFNFQKGRAFLESESEALSTQYFSEINDALNALGSDARLSRIASSVLTSSKGRGGVFATGQLSTGQFFGDVGATSYEDVFSTTREIVPYEQNRNTSIKNAEEGLRLYVEQLDQLFLQTLQAASPDFAPAVREYLNNLGDVELLDQAGLTNAKATVAMLNAVNEAFGQTGDQLGALENQSLAVVQTFIEAVGGLEGFQQSFSGYVNSIYTEQEQLDLATTNLTKAFEQLGVPMPDLALGTVKAKDAFQALVESQDLTTEEGARLYGQLLQLAPSFAQVAEATVNATDKSVTFAQSVEAAYQDLQQVERTAQDVAKERIALESQLNDLLGLSLSARDAERAAIDETNLALYDRIQALKGERAESAERTERLRAERAEAKRLADLEQDAFSKAEQALKSINAEATKLATGIGATGIGLAAKEIEANEAFIKAIGEAQQQYQVLKEAGVQSERTLNLLNGAIDGLTQNVIQMRLAAGDVQGAFSAFRENDLRTNKTLIQALVRGNGRIAAEIIASQKVQQGRLFAQSISQNALGTQNLEAALGSAIGLISEGVETLNQFKADDISSAFGEAGKALFGTILSSVNYNNNLSTNFPNAQGVLGIQYAREQANLAARAFDTGAIVRNLDQFRISTTYLGEALAGGRTTTAEAAQALAYLADEGIVARDAALDASEALKSSGDSAVKAQIAISGLKDAINSQIDATYALAEEYAREAERIRLTASAYSILNAAVKSSNYYFAQISTSVLQFNSVASNVAPALDETTGAIERMRSAAFVFGESASAIAEGLEARALLGDRSDTSNIQSTLDNSLAVSEAAKALGLIITTKAANAVEEDLLDLSFGLSEGQSIRDISLLLQDIAAFDTGGLERTFLRLSDALNQGQISVAQYNELIEYSRDIYLDTAAKEEEAQRAFNAQLDEARSRLESARNELDQLAKASLGFANDIRKIRDDLLLSTTQTPFATQVAREQFLALTNELRSGDTSRFGELSGSANSFVEFARSNSSNFVEFVKQTALVQSELASLENQFRSEYELAVDYLVEAERQTGVLLSIEQGIENVVSALNAFNSLNGVPQFANGGVVSGATLAMIGEGRFNEAVVPLPDGRSIPVQMMGQGQQANQALVSEIRELRAEVAKLRADNSAENRAIATSSAKTAQVLVRVTENGDSIYTEPR